MIYAFTEVEKEQIESSGMMVVEFKRNLRMIESMGKAVSHAWYKAVKTLSKCTGLEKREVWKMTRHTRLARSCC